MSTFTIRVTSPATNVGGTGFGHQTDLGDPSFWDLYVTNSTDPVLANGRYDAYCLNPTQALGFSPTTTTAEALTGDDAANYTPSIFPAITQTQVDQLNWLMAQRFTTDAKYGGAYNYGELQLAIWKILGYTDTQIAAVDPRFLNSNGLTTVSTADAAFLVSAAQSAIANGQGALPLDSFFTEIIDPAGVGQPLIVQLHTAKLGNYVWLDTNADGLQNGVEVGVNNVVVELYSSTGVLLASTVTGDDFSTVAVEQGYYQFAGLSAGSYQVKFISPTYAFTAANAGSSDAVDSDADVVTGLSQVVTLAAGESNQTVDAGLVEQGPALPPAMISGYVYQDAGNDGVRNSEPAIAGVTITLTGTDYLGAPVTATTTTNAAGYYEFIDLLPGSYQVVETQPAGYLDGKDTAGTTGGVVSNDKITTIPLAAGEHSQENNFGELPPAKISGYVYQDAGNDGVRNSEPAIAGTTVTLTGTDDLGNPVTATATTNAAGYYEFTGLRPGSYQVVETQPAGYLDGKDTAGTTGGVVSNDKITTIPLAAGEHSQENNFGELPPAKISGYVYQDAGNDGVRNSEPAIAGTTVTLTGTDDLGNPVTATATTNAAGYYEFTGLRPGSYQVVETQPAGYLDGKDTAGTTGGVVSNDQITTIPLAAGEHSQENNFGELPPAKISGYVYQDAGNDGVRNSEPAIAGTTVTLTGTDDLGNPVTATATTNAAGYYEFTGLRPGSYQVVETQPAGYLDGKDTAGTTGGVVSNDQITTIPLAAGEHSQENNFGELPPAKISGYVYQDAGNDGVRNSEPAIAGTTVTLTGTDDLGNPVTATATTNAAGYYEFTGLRPGSYQVVETQPAGYLDGKDTAGTTGGVVSNDQITTIPLAAGEHSQENNFGELPATASLGDRIWVDTNGNGQQDDGATGISGLTVTLIGGGADGLINGIGDTTTTTVTGTDGYYKFNNLIAGTQYQVQFSKPTGYSYTTADQGLDASDSDANVTTGKSQVVTLASGENNLTVDAGLLKLGSLGDRVWEDCNANGIQDSGEVGIAGVSVTLKGAGKDGVFGTADDISATTTTNSSGNYLFSNLNAGKYTVTFGSPTGYKMSKADQGANDATDSDANVTTRTTGTYTLGIGQQNLTVDAGMYRTCSVGDRVWGDMNGNNVQDYQDINIYQCTVRLYTSAGVLVGTTTTDMNGKYLFSNLDPGSYYLSFDKSTGWAYNYDHWEQTGLSNWKYVVKDAGYNDATDSDVAGNAWNAVNVSKTDVFTLVCGQADMTRDAGITPIVIDLDGNGIQTISRENTTAGFDLFGNGGSVKSGWISSGDGFLAVDKNGNGQIDNINELFGGTAKGAGFANLAAYDSNGDGWVNNADAAFGQLMIWRDLNGNHVTDAGELMNLAQAGVASLKTSFVEMPEVDAQGNLHLERSSATLSDGHSVAMTDVYFNVSADDAAAAGVKLPTIAELLGHDGSLDGLLGASSTATVFAQAGHMDAVNAGFDSSEALRRLALLSKEAANA